MTRYHHRVDGSKAKDDPNRVQLVPFTVEEEVARDAEEAVWEIEKQVGQQEEADKKTLISALRAGAVSMEVLQDTIADILEGKA